MSDGPGKGCSVEFRFFMEETLLMHMLNQRSRPTDNLLISKTYKEQKQQKIEQEVPVQEIIPDGGASTIRTNRSN